MSLNEAPLGQEVDLSEGGNETLLYAIAHPAVFEAQCQSAADVKQAFRQRGFDTEGSSQMTFYGGKGKYNSGTPDQCLVRCGKQIVWIKTSLSTRPEAEVEVLVTDADKPDRDDIATTLQYVSFLARSAVEGPGYLRFARRFLPRSSDDTLRGQNVDDTLPPTARGRADISHLLGQ